MSGSVAWEGGGMTERENNAVKQTEQTRESRQSGTQYFKISMKKDSEKINNAQRKAKCLQRLGFLGTLSYKLTKNTLKRKS